MIAQMTDTFVMGVCETLNLILKKSTVFSQLTKNDTLGFPPFIIQLVNVLDAQ